MVAKLVDAEQFTYAVLAAVDHIDKHEASAEAVGAALTNTLMVAGYPEIDSHAAAKMSSEIIIGSFRDHYWRTQGALKQAGVFMAALNTTIKIIEEGRIDETLRRDTAAKLAAIKRDSE